MKKKKPGAGYSDFKGKNALAIFDFYAGSLQRNSILLINLRVNQTAKNETYDELPVHGVEFGAGSVVASVVAVGVSGAGSVVASRVAVGVSVGVSVTVGVRVGVSVGGWVGVWVGVPVAVGGIVVAVGVLVGVALGSTVLVGVGVSVAGKGVGVFEATTVGNDWVGVGSRVEVGGPTTRVPVGVGKPSPEGEGLGWLSDGVELGTVTVNGVGVIESTAGAEARVANPRQ